MTHKVAILDLLAFWNKAMGPEAPRREASSYNVLSTPSCHNYYLGSRSASRWHISLMWSAVWPPHNSKASFVPYNLGIHRAMNWKRFPPKFLIRTVNEVRIKKSDSKVIGGPDRSIPGTAFQLKQSSKDAQRTWKQLGADLPVKSYGRNEVEEKGDRWMLCQKKSR